MLRENHLEDAVYVGDIQGDYDASKAAGVKFIHAAYGFGEIEDEVPRIEKPLELKEVISKKSGHSDQGKSPHIRKKSLVYGDFFLF